MGRCFLSPATGQISKHEASKVINVSLKNKKRWYTKKAGPMNEEDDECEEGGLGTKCSDEDLLKEADIQGKAAGVGFFGSFFLNAAR